MLLVFWSRVMQYKLHNGDVLKQCLNDLLILIPCFDIVLERDTEIPRTVACIN